MPELATAHSLDLPKITAIEYPANVQNEERAIEMVGGPEAIAKATETRDTPLELRFRDDPFEHPISSRLAKNSNILLKITVAKRHVDAAGGDLRKALELAEGQYEAVPTNIIEANFRFREMSDYQYNTMNSPFINKFRESLATGDLEAVKSLKMEGANMLKDDQADIVPPPKFSSIKYPFPYAYKQNPAVAVVDDGSGGSKLINTTASQKLDSVIIGWDEEVPTGPQKQLAEPTGNVKSYVEKLKEMFDERPLWTRRAMKDRCNLEEKNLRLAIPYVAYLYKSGPYRGGYVKYGIDVKSTSDYAIYQIEHFRLFSKEEEESIRKRHRPTQQKEGEQDYFPYIFDGVHMPNPGMVQFCDITDPELVEILQSAKIREKPDYNDGWYEHRFINAVRKIIKIKMVALKEEKDMTSGSVRDPVDEALLELQEAEYNKNNEMEDTSYSDGTKDPAVSNKNDYEESATKEHPSMDNEQDLLKKVSAVTAEGGKELDGLFGYVRQEDQNKDVSGYNIMGESSSDDSDEGDEDYEERNDDGGDGNAVSEVDNDSE